MNPSMTGIMGASATRGANDALASRVRSESIAGVQPSIVPDVTWWARITGATLIGGASNRWEYTWEQVFAGEATGAWTTSTGGRTHSTHGLAYNRMETGNTGAGVEGNGVDRANLPVGFSMQAIATGAIVQMHGPFGASGTQWCSFSAVNSDDGACS